VELILFVVIVVLFMLVIRAILDRLRGRTRRRA
jgi:hypothetical protein